MLRTLVGRILLAALLPLVIALVALGLFLGARFEAYHLDRMHADLVHEARLTARLLALDLAAGRREAVAAAVAELAQARPEARLIVVDAQGVVVAAPPRDASSAHAAAPENGTEQLARLPGLAIDSGINAGTADELGRALRGETVLHHGNEFDAKGIFVALPVRHEERIVGALHLAYDVGHVAALTRDLRLTVLAAVLVAGAFAALVALTLARSLTRPVGMLARAATRLADGHLDERVAPPPTVELAALASAFNHLAARLQLLETARRNFLADISHDLRAPVGAIQAATETLLAGAEEDPELRHRLLAGIAAEMRRLARLTDDLLALARFEAGRLELRRRPTSLGLLVQDLLAGFASEAAERGIALAEEVSNDLPLLYLDPDRVAQVLTNLLTNALKFTPHGGRVTVRASATPSHVLLAVSDTGPGIPPEDLPRLFDRFYQARDGRARQPGLGLGLAIVRALVEAHGGHVAVESHPGAGSTFTVLLPREDTTATAGSSPAPPTPAEMKS